MHLTTFSDYTLRVLMYLALHRERLVTIPEIASAYGVSRNHLMKVVHELVRAGDVASLRGKGGGLRLARAAHEIRLGAVVRRAEGEAPIVECFSGEASASGCRIASVCRLRGALAEGFDAFFQALDRYTLADLAQDEQPLRLALLGEQIRPSDGQKIGGVGTKQR